MEEKELTCKCGNDTFSDGFFPCDENGKEIEPTIESDWDGLYVCAKCGKSINLNSTLNQNFKSILQKVRMQKK